MASCAILFFSGCAKTRQQTKLPARFPQKRAKERPLMSKKTELQVDGKTLVVSNLDKVLYPDTGFTKADVIDYYIRIAPVLLPYLKNRPIMLKRYPDGVDGFFFYE